ncbi:glycoside hydrolase family 18 protein [Cryptosporangium aurantiacum]|uniref:Chitinase family 18 n=1 Tax=Cryptosporangium aurantiacum TaxID=134849 RepID=A0A1M7RC01_9ACTN|nr:cellulose binding domain-containing protein [Cryptosporangium aurantiacum]SHN43736.1 chitinase family 18 [Cryptosporangium aurantiacum]
MPPVPVREQPPDGFRGGHRRRRSRKPIRRLGVAGLLATVVAVTVATFTAGQAQAAGFSVSYVQSARWDSGYTGAYTVTNTGADAVESWSLAFTLPDGARITSLWNGRMSVSGRDVTVRNETWNGRLAPDASVVVGFVADATGTEQAAPDGCTINGVSCTESTGEPITAGPSDAPSAPAAPKPTAPNPAATSTAPATSAAPVAPGPPVIPGSPVMIPGTPAPTGTEFAPYVDVLLHPPYDLAAAAASTGVRQYTLGFLVANGGCTPSWGGVLPVGDAGIARRVSALREAGGDVRLSFGGATGTELATVCSTPEQLAAAYQSAIDAYAATRIDFDVEGAALADTAANRRRAEAITILRQTAAAAGRPLDVSVTLPVLPQGLTQGGVDLLTDARAADVVFDAVNVMAMDYGDAAAPDPAGRMGRFAIDAVTAVQAQVRGVFGLSDDAAWRSLAVTPMIGVNDVATEVFTPADARIVAEFARSKELAWYSMWSAARDTPCVGGPKPVADPTCSGLAEEPLAFTRAFVE